MPQQNCDSATFLTFQKFLDDSEKALKMEKAKKEAKASFIGHSSISVKPMPDEKSADEKSE
jgi:hypothetical protein